MQEHNETRDDLPAEKASPAHGGGSALNQMMNFDELLVSELHTTRETYEDSGRGDIEGRYELGEELGHGGFGVVYRARQTHPLERDIAIKVLRPVISERKEAQSRFRSEQKALSVMDHPNVAGVLDAGSLSDGRPFLVMELLQGEPITAYCDSHQLSIEQRVELFIEVCEGIQHAHQKGIIHRDIKPSNVLVVDLDKKPTVKVIDFGISKAALEMDLNATRQTQVGQLLGSPAYMSPEQTGPGSRDIDTRSDQYSLGVLLYQLLTGTLPIELDELFEGGYLEMTRLICEREPDRPSNRLSAIYKANTDGSENANDVKRKISVLDGDLDWITMRCLEKDRERRYETVAGLIADLRRHLNHEPVLAARPSTLYQFKKFVRRNRAMFIAGSFMAVASMLGLVVASLGLMRAINAESATEAQLQKAISAEENVRRDLKLAIKAEADAASRLKLANDVKNLTRTMLEHTYPVELGGEDTQLLEQILDQTATRLDRVGLTDKLIEIEMRQFLTDSYLKIGSAQKAEYHLSGILSLLRHHSMEMEPSTDVTGWCNLRQGLVNSLLGFDEEAKQLLQQEVRRRSGVFGIGEPQTSEAQRALASRFRGEGDLQAALDLHLQANSSLPAKDDDAYEAWLNGQASVVQILFDQARFEEAEKIGATTLAAKREFYSADHPSVHYSTMLQGLILGREGDFEKSSELLQESYEVRLRILGADHPATRLGKRHMADAYVRAEKFDRALPVLIEIVNRTRETGSELDNDTFRAMDQLATVQIAIDQSDAARQSLIAAFEERKKLLGKTHQDTLASQMRLAQFYQTRDKAAAKSTYEALLQTQREAFGDEHQSTLQTAYLLGDLCLDMKEYRFAVSILTSTLAAQKCTTEVALDTIGTQLCLCEARLRAEQPNHHETEFLLLEACEKCEQIYGKEHVRTIKAKRQLAWLYLRMERYADAEKALLPTLKIAKKTLEKNHRVTIGMIHLLASIRFNLGKYADANELISKVYQVRLNKLGPDDTRTRSSHDLLVSVLDSQLKKQHETLGINDEQTQQTRRRLLKILDSSGMDQAFDKVLVGIWQRNIRLLGEDHPETNVSHLALLKNRVYDDVVPDKANLQACLQLRKLDREHENSGQTLDGIGAVLAKMYLLLGMNEEAEAAFLEELAVRERRLGKNDSSTRAIMNDLAWQRIQFGKLKEAVSLAERVCEIDESLNDFHWARLDTLAEAYFRSGQIEKAYATQKKAIALPDSHPLAHEHMQQYTKALQALKASEAR